MFWFPNALLHVAAIIYLVIIVYVLYLAARLVKAVERIADKLTPPNH